MIWLLPTDIQDCSPSSSSHLVLCDPAFLNLSPSNIHAHSGLPITLPGMLSTHTSVLTASGSPDLLYLCLGPSSSSPSQLPRSGRAASSPNLELPGWSQPPLAGFPVRSRRKGTGLSSSPLCPRCLQGVPTRHELPHCRGDAVPASAPGALRREDLCSLLSRSKEKAQPLRSSSPKAARSLAQRGLESSGTKPAGRGCGPSHVCDSLRRGGRRQALIAGSPAPKAKPRL